jgi:flagellar basal-body rod protein FlgB
MDFTDIPIFKAMGSKLGYLSERQSLIAQNIANADTPGYRAQDLEKTDFSKALSSQQLAMRKTNKKHLDGAATAAGNYRIINRDSTYELNPTGNNVAIEEEMSKIAENQAEYQKVLNLYRKSTDMFKTAIGKTGG